LSSKKGLWRYIFDYIDRKSTLDASGKMKALGGLMNILVQFPDMEEMKNLISQRIKRFKSVRTGGKRRTRKSKRKRKFI
jgi:hypothetical protein